MTGRTSKIGVAPKTDKLQVNILEDNIKTPTYLKATNIYNANIYLFCLICILLEIPPVHKWDLKFWPKSHRGQARN